LNFDLRPYNLFFSAVTNKLLYLIFGARDVLAGYRKP
jgi:hypothetical protein